MHLLLNTKYKRARIKVNIMKKNVKTKETLLGFKRYNNIY